MSVIQPVVGGGGGRKTVIVPQVAALGGQLVNGAHTLLASSNKRPRSDVIVLDDEEFGSKKRFLSQNSVLHEQLLLEEIKLKKMKELHYQPPPGRKTDLLLSGDSVSSAVNNLTAQVQQSLLPGPVSPTVTTSCATGPISISARLQQVIDATAMSNVRLAGTEQPTVRKVVKKNVDKKIFSAPYPKTYRQVWPIVPVSDNDFMKNFGLESVCNYFDSKWQMEQLVKQKHAAAAAKPVCHQCKCDFASAWQVRKNNSHSLLLCESCDFKNLKILQREKISNHLKDLLKVIQQQDLTDPDQNRTNSNVTSFTEDQVPAESRPRIPQRVNSKVSKFRVEPRPSDAILHVIKQPTKTTSAEGDVAKQQWAGKEKGKSLLKDKLDQISKQLLEKRLQEGKVSTGHLLEQPSGKGEASNGASDARSSSPQRPRRKQVTPKAMRKPSGSDTMASDSCNA